MVYWKLLPKLKKTRNHVHNMLKKKMWYIIIDDIIKEQHPNLQLQFTRSVDDFAFKKAKNEVNDR